MRDPFTWSMPLGRVFGIAVRMHWLFPVVALGLTLRVALHKDMESYLWVEAILVELLLLVVVVLHEFCHCCAARHRTPRTPAGR